MLVWLHDDFPGPTAVSCLDHPAILHDILSVARCSFKHSPEIDLGEAAVLHPLEQMWAEFQLPFPPLRPVALSQLATPLPRGVQ